MTGGFAKSPVWGRLPSSIRAFIVAYLGFSAFLGVNSLLQFEATRLQAFEMIGTADLPGDGWIYGLIVIRLTVAFAILAWVLLHHSLIGRMIIATQLFGWVYIASAYFQMIKDGNFESVPFLLAGLCSAIAVACLMMKGSRDWFARKGRTLADDLDSFS